MKKKNLCFWLTFWGLTEAAPLCDKCHLAKLQHLHQGEMGLQMCQIEPGYSTWWILIAETGVGHARLGHSSSLAHARPQTGSSHARATWEIALLGCCFHQWSMRAGSRTRLGWSGLDHRNPEEQNGCRMGWAGNICQYTWQPESWVYGQIRSDRL